MYGNLTKSHMTANKNGNDSGSHYCKMSPYSYRLSY